MPVIRDIVENTAPSLRPDPTQDSGRQSDLEPLTRMANILLSLPGKALRVVFPVILGIGCIAVFGFPIIFLDGLLLSGFLFMLSCPPKIGFWIGG